MTNQLANPFPKQNRKNSLKKPVSNKMALNMEGATFWYVCCEMRCDIIASVCLLWYEVGLLQIVLIPMKAACFLSPGLGIHRRGVRLLKGSFINSGNWAGSVKKARGRLGSHDAPGIHFPKLSPVGCCLLVLMFVSDSRNKRSSLWLSCWVYSERMADFWL